MPRLIVNGDDLGFTPGVNVGILKAHHEGIVTSSTVMVNMPHAEAGIHAALEQAPELALGLHINLCAGRPVLDPAEVPSLVDAAGNFFPPEELLQIAMQFDGDELYAEIAAQIDRFHELAGRLPTHLDCHYHVAYLHPLALEATLRLAHEHGNLPLRRFHPYGDEAKMLDDLASFMPDIDRGFFAQLLPMLRQVIDNAPTPPNMPANFESGFGREHTALGDMLNILVTLPDDTVTELLCHPGQAPDPTHPRIEARQQELDILTHPTTLEVVERYDIQLITYADLQTEG